MLTTDVYLTSVNGVSETGELENIDSTGNRAADSLFGDRRGFFAFGTNKIGATLIEPCEKKNSSMIHYILQFEEA